MRSTRSAPQPADDLDHLFHARQWFKLQSAVTDRSLSLMRAAVATAFNDPETAKRLPRDVIRSAPTAILPARYVRLNVQIDF